MIGHAVPTSTKADEANRLRRENIKAKVGYEWKQIFKYLNKFDVNQTGTVTKN